MRGFWCLVVILVHTPAMYQNTIQDMIGSFAYIGVTFFFMTSGYGLKLGVQKNPESISFFWRKRLPKLLIPYYLISLFSCVVKLYEGEKVNWLRLPLVSGWVAWLLICYFMFWLLYRFNVFGQYKDYAISASQCPDWLPTPAWDRKYACPSPQCSSRLLHHAGYAGRVCHRFH